jgi:hypothetical protein
MDPCLDIAIAHCRGHIERIARGEFLSDGKVCQVDPPQLLCEGPARADAA